MSKSFKLLKMLLTLAVIIISATILLVSCDEEKNNEIPSNTSPVLCYHNYTNIVTTPATCTQEGVRTFTCSICNNSYQETINATGHNFGSWAITTPAECESKGVETRFCDCGKVETREFAAAGHKYGNWIISTPATCNSTGTKKRECIKCHLKTEIFTIPIKNHTYTSQTTTESTCTSSGVKTFTCSDCGKSYTETIAPKQHNWLSATCTEPQKCSLCNETTGNALGHNYNSSYKCTKCGFIKEAKFILPDVPKTISTYNYSNKISTSSKIESITVSRSSSTTYKITVKGICTYNIKGNNQSSSMAIGYKLYDSEGYVIKSGTMYSESVAVGEKFTETLTFYDLTSDETYTLVLLSVN